MPVNVFGQNTHKRWHRAIAATEAEVLVFSPYLTSRTAEWLISSNKATTVYTCFRVEAFLTGASSLDTLSRLIRRGFQLFHVAELHAKVVTDRKTFLFAGSQNVTRRGTRNREVTVWTDESAAIGKIDDILSPWIAEGVLISEEMIADTRELIRPLKIAAQSLQTAVETIQEQVEAAELSRLQVRRREQIEAEAARERREVQLYRTAMQRRLDLLGDGITRVELARRIVADSIWWTSHSSGKPVRARRHASRVSEHDPKRKLRLGANYFAVGDFVQKAKATLARFFDRRDAWDWSGPYATPDGVPGWVVEELMADVQSSVVHENGKDYVKYPKGSDGFMRFGTQAVSVVDCVRIVLAVAGLHKLPEDDLL